ncbi:hypothetical protein CVD28_03710 [Bacillus sp. M6-12]|uniref:hypothetical protein n=1 Tax=Bacillus sp. M6-12 TaxID=2054166 RepID=UPI000C75A17A|nr:hypothetical protein [Bacillus sp. M6-12]PLS19534.1 hypothetical protein CVD28_03710 [Bacillus sp. M6-12]
MKAEKRTVFTTEDGKTFFDKQEAEKHEEQLKNQKAYRVRYCPDLNETGMLQKTGYIICHARWGNELWVEDWLYKKFGNRIDFVQGVSPTEKWRFEQIETDKVEADKILATLHH